MISTCPQFPSLSLLTPKASACEKPETHGIHMDVCRCQLYFRDGGIEKSPRLSGFWRLPRIAHNQLATSHDDRRCLNSIEIEGHDCRREEKKSCGMGVWTI
ncbi:hypothetical protein V8C40DRAFT_253838 [Trichoderma camerunense]